MPLALKPDLADAEFWLGSSLVAIDPPESDIPYLLHVTKDPRCGVQADDVLIKPTGRLPRITTNAPGPLPPIPTAFIWSRPNS